MSICCRQSHDEADLEKGKSHDLEGEDEEKDKELQDVSIKNINGMRIEEYASSPKLQGKASFSALNALSEVPAESSSSETQPSSESSSESEGEGGRKIFKARKWPTRWYWQFLVLLVRTFRQSRHVILSKFNLIQTFLLTVVSSIIWFQLPNHEDSISDRYGYVSTRLEEKNECSMLDGLVFLS